MPAYFFWGENEYKITEALQKLKTDLVDALWLDFNYVKISGSSDQQHLEALNQASTPPFGAGNRLTWIADSAIAQRCPDNLLAELERTFSNLPTNSHLVFTSSTKPDGRIKSTKLLQKYASIQEFAVIASWDTKAIALLVKESAAKEGVNLTPDGVEFLAEAVGSDSRRLSMELQKLKLMAVSKTAAKPLNAEAIAQLVNQSAHNSFQLAGAMRTGNTSQALSLLAELLANNEAGLRICATLTGQFRTWLWVKLMQEAGEKDDKAIATAAELANPKRVYFLKQEVQNLTSKQLLQALPILLNLEVGLKSGIDETAGLQTAVIQLCNLSK